MSPERQPRRQVRVLDVARHGNDPRIAAFAIDSPQRGAVSPGAGIEISGWVIGEREPVVGVRILNHDQMGTTHPLDVPRPDVAGDYPALPLARKSGFLCWTGLAAEVGETSLVVQAILADETSIDLATVRLDLTAVEIETGPDFRLVDRPDFLIIGTQRGGTTSLHAYLGAHSQITLPETKEIHYLTDRHARGEDWYRGQFPARLPAGYLTGEATPYALFHPLAPRRLAQTAPDAKLIVLLRNPVERAYSHYLMERQRGDEPLDFAAALDAEATRLAGEEARLVTDPAYASRPHKHFSYQARGDYTHQLRRWFATFPQEQMLILRSEDLYARTADTFTTVTAFLGLPPGEDIPFAVYNRNTGPPLSLAMRERLVAHFAPANAALADLLGWDPGWT
ncbi:MAG: sulfotransferase [Thermomicrobiales bacterium]